MRGVFLIIAVLLIMIMIDLFHVFLAPVLMKILNGINHLLIHSFIHPPFIKFHSSFPE